MKPGFPSITNKHPPKLNIKGCGLHNRCHKRITAMHIRYRVGYCNANGVSPSQVSSQKRVSLPSPTINFVLLKKAVLTLISPFQNGESVGRIVTCDKVLDCKYLLRSICAQVASVPTDNLSSHLLSRHLFLTSRFSIPNPS